jgi:hypothetical protein
VRNCCAVHTIPKLIPQIATRLLHGTHSVSSEL